MYDLGDVIPLRQTVRDEAGNLADVTEMTVTVTLPDGTTSVETPSNTSTGTYTLSYQTLQAGRHLARFVGTGANAMAQVKVFDVRSADWPAIVSLDDVKQQQRIQDSNTDLDEDLREVIEAATHVIEGYVGAVARRTVTQTVSGCGSAIVLNTIPVLSVTEVVEDGATLDPDAYSLNVSTGLLTKMQGTRSFRFASGVNNVTVTYVVGRTLIPANFTLAAKLIVQHLWETRRGSSGSPRFGGSTTSSRYGGVDDVLIEAGQVYAIPRRAIELLEKHMSPGGVA